MKKERRSFEVEETNHMQGDVFRGLLAIQKDLSMRNG